MNAKHWADKPILRQLFWFLVLPHQAKQWVDRRTDLEKDAGNLLLALHDAWPYVHQWSTIDSIKTRISGLMRKHGDFADVWKDFDDEKESSAIDTLRLMGYTYHGGDLWKPPLGEAPDFDRLDRKVGLVADARYCLDNPDVLHSPAEHRKIIEGLLSFVSHEIEEKPFAWARPDAVDVRQDFRFIKVEDFTLPLYARPERADAANNPAPSTAGHYGPLRDADAEHGQKLSVYGNDPKPGTEA
jgi:hypothetical protein